MFQLPETTEARLTSVTNRVERHGDDEHPAVSLGISIDAANTVLDRIDPHIREALYKPVDRQDSLPGVEPSTPVLRCNSFDKHTLTTSHEGWTLEVDEGIDESTPLVFGGCKIDKFVVEAKQGGSIVLRFRVSTSDVDADRLGKLAMHIGQAIWIRLSGPDPNAEAIDGSTEAFAADYPDATDLFARAHDTGHDEGGPIEDEPPSATEETSRPRTRTARGREATRKALEAGMAEYLSSTQGA
ncbi:hypothetical protein [Caldimonas taiwanensis]|uniref:hypothetical protein n=1 Tax=Caldimonas taiwanensis TaxID=307483 RepID=UPI0007831D9A|nr:hypothetical protein [Caldimonas taiwanensis]